MRIITVDLGTTTTKAALFDDSLSVLGEASEENQPISPQPGWQELDADAVLRAVVQTVSALAKGGKCDALCFSSMMHSLIAIDAENRPLTGVMLWNDTRSLPYVQNALESGEGLAAYQRTGTPCHPMSPAYKIAWLRDTEPEIFQKTARFVSIKEYVLFHLLDEWVVDYSTASASGLLNLHTLEWDADILENLGIRAEQLSTPLDTLERIDGLTLAAAEAMGLPEGTSVVLGASDGCLANLGANAIVPGRAAVTIGTSGAARVCVDHPTLHPEGKVFCYYLAKDRYIAGGAVNNGGIAFRWLRDQMGKGRSLNYELINTIISQVPSGAHGLLFLPYLYGERAPYWDARLRGAFVGLSGMHGFDSMARAVVEGICFGLRDVLESVPGSEAIESVQADGGFTFSQEWVRTLADVLGRPLELSQSRQGPAVGAAMLALVALGRYHSLEECAEHIPKGGRIEANAENHALYDTLFPLFRQATGALTPVMHELSALQRKENS